MVYFAYGSNMLRARLEARVGSVQVVGPGLLRGYRHSFTKLGHDGTGKGNIQPRAGHVVYGVLYRLHPAQMNELNRFEGGYHRVTLKASRIQRPSAAPFVFGLLSKAASEMRASDIQVQTYRAVRPVLPMKPSPEYLDYYVRGIREHGLPEVYRAFLLAQANLE